MDCATCSSGNGDGHLQAAPCLRSGVPRPAGRGAGQRPSARRLRPPRQDGEDKRAVEEAEHGPSGKTPGKEGSIKLPLASATR